MNDSPIGRNGTVLLVSVAELTIGTYCRHSILDPIGLEYLAAAVSAAGFTAHVRNVWNYTDDQYIELLNILRPGVVGFTAVTFEIGRVLHLARLTKQVCPMALTVMGGYHASALPQTVADPALDCVVLGEGEQTFVELVKVVSDGGDFHRVAGVAYWDSGLRKTTPRARVEDLDCLPDPVRVPEFMAQCRVGGFVYPPPSKQRGVCQVSYSRGCPHGCKFCCSAQLWGSLVRWRSPARLVDELVDLQRRFGTNLVFFSDLTFNASRTKVLELCREIKSRRLAINWMPMCRLDSLDREVLTAMRDAGCLKISFGIDATRDATLAEYKPSQPVSIGRIREALELPNELGMIVRGYVIIGYPDETAESLDEAERVLQSLPIDDLRMSFLTPFPGTELYDDYRTRGLLLTDDFARFTSEEPIVRIPGLPLEAMVAARARISRRFYTSEGYQRRIERKLQRFAYLKDSYAEFVDFLRDRNVV